MTIQQKATIEEFLQWPEQKPYLELLYGVARPKTLPDFPHNLVQAELAKRIGVWSDSVSGYTLTEQRCILEADGEEHTVLPDVAWFSTEQLPVPPLGAIRTPPTLAVEVLSPNDRFGDVQEKVLLYLHAGVPVVWVVDPLVRNTSIYRPNASPSLAAPPAGLHDALMPGLLIPLVELFARLPVDETSQPRIPDW